MSRISIDLTDAENRELIRLRKRRGITNREAFIADLVRRELRQAETPAVDKTAQLKDDVYRRAVAAVEELPRMQKALAEAQQKARVCGEFTETLRTYFYTQQRLAAQFRELNHKCTLLEAEAKQAAAEGQKILEAQS